MKQNILITGGNGPLGRDITKCLSKNHNVIITTRKKEIEEVNEGVKVLHEIDLLTASGLEKLHEQVNGLFKDKFSVINCTGYYGAGQEPFLDPSLEEDYRVFDSNFKTVYNTSKTLLPLMIERGGGHFITFSCNSVGYNYPWMIPFTAAKTAVEALSKGLANEFSKDGIFSNCIQLATILTEHEIERKPYGDHKNWLKTTEVARYIEEVINYDHPYFNGNVIKLFKYSESYYNQSYFDRIKK